MWQSTLQSQKVGAVAAPGGREAASPGRGHCRASGHREWFHTVVSASPCVSFQNGSREAIWLAVGDKWMTITNEAEGEEKQNSRSPKPALNPYQDLGLESKEYPDLARQVPSVKPHGGIAAGPRVAVSEVATLPVWLADWDGRTQRPPVPSLGKPQTGESPGPGSLQTDSVCKVLIGNNTERQWQRSPRHCRPVSPVQPAETQTCVQGSLLLWLK